MVELYIEIGERKYLRLRDGKIFENCEADPFSRVAMPQLNLVALQNVLGYDEELMKKVKKAKVAYTRLII